MADDNAPRRDEQNPFHTRIEVATSHRNSGERKSRCDADRHSEHGVRYGHLRVPRDFQHPTGDEPDDEADLPRK